ncbi:MAG: cytochrome c biogenesis CcdA family protein, partial [Bosea sp. (in: a-proteobacteria)]
MIDVSALGISAALAAGVISFASPCVLPLIPGYVSYISGGVGTDGERRLSRLAALWPALWFVLGFTTLFIALGLSVQVLGGVLQRYSVEANYISGALIIVFGLILTGLLKVPALSGDYRWRGPAAITGPGSAYLLGVAFAFGWTPCIGPVLASILVVTATSATSGAILLGAYGLGLGIPFLLTALFIGEISGVLSRLRWTGRLLNIFAGGIMIGMGILM